MREKNGERVFWGRGNGWVTAGLTVIIDNMPDDYPAKARYVALFREMMERIAGLQGADGFWHASLLDPASYPAPETSATGFFTYSLLWGVNRGLLDRAHYGPVAERGGGRSARPCMRTEKWGMCSPSGPIRSRSAGTIRRCTASARCSWRAARCMIM